MIVTIQEKGKKTTKDNLVMITEKITNMLFTGKLTNAEGTAFITVSQGEKMDTSVRIVNLGSETDRKPDLYPFDGIVFAAIATLFANNCTEQVTTGMMYRAITGNPKAVVSPKMNQRILESVERLASTGITIYCEEESIKYVRLEESYRGLLLSCQVSPDRKVITLDADHCLPLWEYVAAKKQFTRVRKDILLCGKRIPNTLEVIVARDYLVRQIILRKRHPNFSRLIELNGVYDYVEMEPALHGKLSDNKWRKRLRDNVYVMLNKFSRVSFIDGYKVVKRGNTHYAVEVQLSEPKAKVRT